MQGYESQYGISLSKRSLVAISTTPKNQLADESQSNHRQYESGFLEDFPINVFENSQVEIVKSQYCCKFSSTDQAVFL
jgi:hypothetical protein